MLYKKNLFVTIIVEVARILGWNFENNVKKGAFELGIGVKKHASDELGLA